MQQWLESKRQPRRAIERFWRPVLVSAINEELDRMSARHGFQVFRLGFLARADAYQRGVPAVPLSQLYRGEAWSRVGNVDIRPRAAVERIAIENRSAKGVIAGGETLHA